MKDKCYCSFLFSVFNMRLKLSTALAFYVILQLSTVQQYLVEKFGEQIIRCGGFRERPQRLPDLTPIDFFREDTSNSRCMWLLRQHYRTFKTAQLGVAVHFWQTVWKRCSWRFSTGFPIFKLIFVFLFLGFFTLLIIVELLLLHQSKTLRWKSLAKI